MAKKTEAQSHPIVIRTQAKAAGLKKYFTGVPCPHGHVAFRSVADYKCMECVRLRAAAWCKENRERASVRRRCRYVADAEIERARSVEWRRQNPGRGRAPQAKWERANPEACRIKCRNRRAKKRTSGGTHTPEQIKALAKRQKYRCANPACRASIREKYHADHIIPLALGGSNSIKNIQLLCPPCNYRKGARHPVDFAQENGLLL